MAVVLAALAVPAFALTASADEQGPSPAERLFSIKPSLSPGADPNSWPLADGRGAEQLMDRARRAVEDAEARERELASPILRQKREASRSTHVGISSAAAVQLAESEFGALLRGSRAEGGLESLAGGRPVAKFLDDRTVVLAEEGDKPPVLLESPSPLRAVAEDGIKRPIDLSLVRRGDGFEPENASVDAYFPEELDGQAVRVGGVGVVPAGSGVAEPLAGGANGVVYPNAQVDTDVAVAPRATGAEIFWQLRSPRATEELTLGLEIPDGAIAEMAPAGSAMVVKDGKPVASVSPPVAVDSQGRDMPVAMEVRGEQLVLSVAHRDQDVAYPILVDPVIEVYIDWDEDYWWVHQGPDAISRLHEWDLQFAGVPYGHYIQRHHCYVPVSCDSEALNPALVNQDTPDGLHVYVQSTPTSYPAGSYGQFVYQPPGTTTQIDWMEMYAFYHRRGGSQYPIMFTGIWSSIGAWMSLYEETMDFGDWVYHQGNTGYSGRHSAVFGFYTPNNVMNGNWRDGYVGGAMIALTDPEPPTINGGQLKRWEKPAGATQETWVDRDATRWFKSEDSLALRPNVSDPGLGVRSVLVTGAGVNNGIDSECYGTKDDPCPAIWPGSGYQDLIDFDVAGMADGHNTLTIHAWDPIIRGSTQAFPIKVDNGVPTISFSGGLWNGREDPAGSGLPVLGPGTHSLSVVAQDPAPSTAPGVATSGVEKVEILIDGDVVATDQGSCAQNCSRTLNWNLDTNVYGGKRTIRARATDGAGNVATSQGFVVNLPTRGELVLPVDGESTSSRVALLAQASEDGFSGVEFQYREMPAGLWKTVGGVGTMLRDDQGNVVSSTSHFLDQPGRRTKKLIWDAREAIDLALLTPKPGPFQVRAVFAGNGGHVSKAANVELDPKGISAGNAQTEVGPGSLDLLSGNFSYMATDAALAGFGQGLTLTRTYNSLDPEAGGAHAPLGPGWVMSSPVEGISDYSSLVELKGPTLEGWVDVYDSAGVRIRFELLAAGIFKPEPGFEDLTLTKADSKYTLTDLDGTVTTFATLAGSSEPVQFAPTRVEEAGQQGVSSFKYGLHAGKPQLQRIIAPSPPGLDCLVAVEQLPRGCKVLELDYSDIHLLSLGQYRRLKSIRHVAWDPATSAMKAEEVARFSYYEHPTDQPVVGTFGRLKEAWDPRVTPVLKERYYYDAMGRPREIAPPGESSWWLWYNDASTSDAGKFAWVVREAAGSGQEAWSVNYRMPLTGYGAWFEMGPQIADAIGQIDRPTDGTVVVRNAPGDNQYLYTGHYLNQDGREVNLARPGLGVETTEYDRYGNVVRELSAQNRGTALAAGGGSVTAAGLLSTYRTYSSDGLRMTEELGPEHQVKLDSGATVDARARTTMTYDEGSTLPIGRPAHLPTTVKTGAQVDPSQPDVDIRVSKTDYNWTLRKPTATIVDAVSGGLNITSRTSYDSAGLEIESRQPKSDGADAGTTRTIYYTHDASSPDPVCRNRPEWFNLPCKSMPAAQPGTAGLPDLAVTTYSYDRLGNVTSAAEQVDGASRTTTTTYDAAGRKIADSLTTAGDGGGPAGLVAAYGFEEGSGSNVADGSGNGNGGTVSGASWTTSGKFGHAMSFDGIDDFVGVADSSSLDLTSAMTLSAWIKPEDSANVRRAVVSKQGPDDAVWGLLSKSPTSGPTVGVRRSSGWAVATTPPPLEQDEWVHLTTTWDGSVARIYLDGTEVASGAIDGSAVVSTGEMRIGSIALSVGTTFFDGLIDEVRVYNRALSQQEIAADKDVSVRAQLPGLGEPVAPASYGYSSTTGRPTTVTSDGQTVTTGYDNVGRVVSYTDSHGMTSTTSYDRLDRPVQVSDGVASQILHYDATTGFLTGLDDGDAGAFTAAYDLDGRVVSKTYPNGLEADTTYDPSGAATRLTYTKTSNCSTNCTWIDEQVTESIHGQWRTHSSELSTQEYSYDRAGRLTQAVDDVHAPGGVAGCTIRSYSFDLNSNRTALNTKAPDANGACQPAATGTTKTYGHDSADRLIGAGLHYDKLGRMTSIPGSYSGGGALTYKYYANDLVRAISQDGVTKTYTLDPAGRQRQTVASDGTTHTERFHYRDSSDTPSIAVVANGQQTVSSERYIEGIDGDLAAIRNVDVPASTDETVLQLSNLHGDTIATASVDPQITQPLDRIESDEYGNPRQTSSADERYAWLGAKQRRTELASGVIQMGVRSYVPALGRFTSVDPVKGGSANDYDYAAQDPVNNFDFDGRICIPCAIGITARLVSAYAARRAAAKAASKGLAKRQARKERIATRREQKAARLLDRKQQRVTRWLNKRGGDHTVKVGRTKVRFNIHDHAGGPHAGRHIQINAFRNSKGGTVPWTKGIGASIRSFF